MKLSVLIVCTSLAACGYDRIADTDSVYFSWDDERVLCAAGFDDSRGNDVENIAGGIGRAAARDEVLLLFGHKPERDFSMAKLEATLDAAEAASVPTVTFADLQQAGGGPGLALTFDDAHIVEWYGMRELLAQRGARVTFFVTRFDLLNDTKVGMLEDLRDDGHAIEAHGRRHRDAPAFTEEFGLQAWVDDELLPSVDNLRAAGFSPNAFAYPFGTRTSGLDAAALEHVGLIRSIVFTEAAGVSDPCPR